MSLEQFDQVVVQGRRAPENDPVEHVISILLSLAPEDIARVQRAIADRVQMFTITGTAPKASPMAADKAAEYEAGGCKR